jgi:glutamate-1-semialdehyde aminotransferase
MNYANTTFISSTFWTERIGSVAGLKTLDIMEKIKSWDIISSLGRKVKANWVSLAKKNNIKLKIQGLSALPRFDFENKNNLYYKTFISQEFLKKKILASNSIYLCTEHNMKIFDNYFDILDSIFFKINRSIEDNIHPQELLNGPVCISGIRSNY